jgi:hypothetical protein
MDTTLYFNSEQQLVKDSREARFKVSILKNPEMYEVLDEDMGSDVEDDDMDVMMMMNATLQEMLPSPEDWRRAVRTVRQSSDTMCQGVISRGFFSEENVNNTSVIFLLHLLQPTRASASERISETLIGFALTIDLRREHEDHYVEEGTLYIDAICTNTEVRDKGVGRIRGAGTLLMNAIELYALNPNNEFEGEPFDNIKLSALPYVIGYYRKLGYRHVHRCRSLERRADGVLVEPSARAEITELAESAALQRKFPNNEVMDNALKIELAKEKKILGTLNEQIENLIANLNQYFRGDDIIFTRLPLDDPRQGRVEWPVIAIDRETGRENAEISELIQQDNKEVLEFLNVLRRYRFSAGCPERQGRTMRHFSMFDEDQEIDFPCLDEGFTMRKCLRVPQERDIDMAGGAAATKRKSKYTIMKRKQGRKTRKKVPWAGWSKISPKGRARTVMKKRCGKKCFLGPKKSFPVCAKGTCKVNKKGVWAAYIRASEWGNKASSYKGRSRPRHPRRTYKRIARTAKKMLKKM